MTRSIAIFGIDFTSAPSRAKPITCAACEFDGRTLRFDSLVRWRSFEDFDRALRVSGPWVAGMDFPFAQPRRLVENLGWPPRWHEYVAQVERLGRPGFRATLEAYKAPRAVGDKHHKRRCDQLSRSQSPQTLHYTPVGLMFFEGAPRLLRSGVHIPHLRDGDTDRVVLECYPGIAARGQIGRRPYKSDTRARQTKEREAARIDLLSRLLAGGCRATYGFELDAPQMLADDPAADDLDALLCAVQAAWAWQRRDAGYGAPSGYDRLEGWICDPAVLAES